ncbi:hypothetical protein NFI96_023503, partial [Prochilodus magdalenae]
CLIDSQVSLVKPDSLVCLAVCWFDPWDEAGAAGGSVGGDLVPFISASHNSEPVTVMDRCVFTPSDCQVALSDVLGLQNQPVCEEQAWALCYQLCSLLEPNFSGELGEGFGSWKTFRLPGPEGILFSSDGSISLRIDSTATGEQFVMETEDQVPAKLGMPVPQTVDYVGRLMYSCLDWGLGADVERELDETLELLVSQMTKVDIRLGAEHCLQPICTVAEVLQVCEERLYNPTQAPQHYRHVCSTLYSHTIELCHYLQIIQQTKESLQKVIVESEAGLLPNLTTNWLEHPHTVPADGAVGVEVEGHQVFWTCDYRPSISVLTTVPPHTPAPNISESPFNRGLSWGSVLQNGAQEFVWKDLIEELSRGVVLRPPKAKLSTSVPLPVDTSPFSQLLQDIQLRRYTLRKVQTGRSGWSKSDPHQALLEVIRSGPKLRPVSERNLKPKVQNPKHETSLHELLMQEIRSADRVKLLSSSRRRQSYKVESACSPSNGLMPIYEDSSHEDTSFFLNTVPNPVQQGAPPQGKGGKCKGSCPTQEDSFTGSGEENLRFLPALSSTPQSPTAGCRLPRGKRRARSFASNQEFYQLALKSKASVPVTIADLAKTHCSSEGSLKTTSSSSYRNWRVCSCCTKRSLYFTWHLVCSLCSRVVCPECCVEMRLPFKWCVNLPLSFFKKIVLNKESDQSQRNFWNERWSWDPS